MSRRGLFSKTRTYFFSSSQSATAVVSSYRSTPPTGSGGGIGMGTRGATSYLAAQQQTRICPASSGGDCVVSNDNSNEEVSSDEDAEGEAEDDDEEDEPMPSKFSNLAAMLVSPFSSSVSSLLFISLASLRQRTFRNEAKA